MLCVPIKDIRPGMVVARPVCHARKRVYFVQKGYALDQRAISRLTSLGVHSLWIECEGLGEVDDKINDRVVEKRQELSQLLTTSVDDLRRRTDAVIDCGQFEAKMGGLLSEILNDPSHEPLVAAMTGDCGALVRHQTNCCYVCLLLGTHLSGYVRHQRRRLPTHLAEDLRALGMGGFVHDLGQVRLSERAQKIDVLHGDSDDAEYRSHPKIGCELLRGQISPLALYMVAHHHQRFDGSGFPKVRPRDPGSEPAGLAGNKIHVFARILAVADAFDRLSGTPQAPRSTIEALHALQQPRFRGWFDPIIVAALNRLVPPFMIGSVVTLTDRRRAVVVNSHAEAPCYPTVRVVDGEPGTPKARVCDEDIDLRATPELNVGSVNGFEVSPFFFEPPDVPAGVMAYWGLRSKAAQSVSVDPSTLVSADEAVASEAAG